ncbi:MAG: hypothetical protein M0P76_03375 [Candidatus Pacebacteria bacterium]|nr:hypothetical protein [Candidatus Paceibacterota bacterium]
MKNIKYIAFGIVFVSVFVVVGLRTNSIKLPIVKKIVSPQLAFNAERNTEIVGASTNIFVGKIIKQSGSSKDKFGSETTQFEVEIIDNIKGKLRGNITVTQMAGYKNGILYTMEGDIVGQTVSDKLSLLNVGSTYLLATGYKKESEQYVLLTFSKARTLITDDENLDTGKLKELVWRNDVVKQFLTAYPDEILMQSDIKSGHTLNSFQSLPVDEQEKIRAEAEQIKSGVFPSKEQESATQASTTE